MKEIELKDLVTPYYAEIMKDEKIRDTIPHNSEIVDARPFRYLSFIIVNQTDKKLTAKIMANDIRSYIGAVQVGTEITINPNSKEIRTITPDTGGWAPYFFVTVSASEPPTKGSVYVKVLARML